MLYIPQYTIVIGKLKWPQDRTKCSFSKSFERVTFEYFFFFILNFIKCFFNVSVCISSYYVIESYLLASFKSRDPENPKKSHSMKFIKKSNVNNGI